MNERPLVALLAAAFIFSACHGDKPSVDAGPGAVTANANANATPTAPVKSQKALALGGSSIALSPGGDALFIADEDHKAVRRVALPLDGQHPDAGALPAGAPSIASFTVPGTPAEVLALGDGRVLVTLRDPGMLFILKPDPAALLAEDARIPLPADAWGVAVTPDEKTALVTSAWSHQLSAVDLSTTKKKWSIDVAREPRGVVVRPDGDSAYVSHLIGAEVTRVDHISAEPTVRRISLPPAPARAPSGKTLRASLGYSLALSPDDKRLFVARHAIGAIGWGAWFGAATVDVLATARDEPLLPKHVGRLPAGGASDMDEDVTVPQGPVDDLVQPRAMLYRERTKTLLVASEGRDTVLELDALSAAPSEQIIHKYLVGANYEYKAIVDHLGDYGNGTGPDGVASECAAPSGMALDESEDELYVYCAGSHDVVAVPLLSPTAKANTFQRSKALRISEDSLSKDAAIGRRFFSSAVDQVTSGGLACAGCHPEGREDGVVWREARTEMPWPDNTDARRFLGEPEQARDPKYATPGYPRQTPMLAGRLPLAGPFGWHGEAKDLDERLREGFHLHRWAALRPDDYTSDVALALRARYLAAFLREGLVPPPREQRELTDEEQLGKKVFSSAATGCTRCHVPGSKYTDSTVYPMPFDAPPTYEKEDNQNFKTPSLLFVGGTPPYFHDGRAATLDDLIAANNDRMGHTNQLSKEERAALVAFLKTL